MEEVFLMTVCFACELDWCLPLGMKNKTVFFFFSKLVNACLLSWYLLVRMKEQNLFFSVLKQLITIGF